MNESQFHEKIDNTLLAIEDALDELDLDIDYLNNGGILTISFNNNSKIILNRQTATQQLWIAARSNGYHLDWSDTLQSWTVNQQQTLNELLNQLLTEQAETVLTIQLD